MPDADYCLSLDLSKLTFPNGFILRCMVFGGRAEEYPEELTVYGGQLTGGTVDAKNDHRLVMSAAIAALRCKEPVTIIGAEAVNKSYPTFFDDYQALGGKVEFVG